MTCKNIWSFSFKIKNQFFEYFHILKINRLDYCIYQIIIYARVKQMIMTITLTLQKKKKLFIKK